MLKYAILALAMLLAGCRSNSSPDSVSGSAGDGLPGAGNVKRATWEWSEAHGDKPGNGLRIVVAGNAIAGEFFLIDPNKPNDFSASRAFPLRGLRKDKLRIDFDLNIPSDSGQYKERVTLELLCELAGNVGSEVRAKWRSDKSPTPMDITLVRKH